MIFLKNKMNKKAKLLSSIILLLILLTAGCKHQITTTPEPANEAFAYITLHIKMGINGLQASPDIDSDILSTLSFTVTAKDQNNREPSTKSDSDFFTPLASSSADSFDYKIKLEPGVWTITITGVYNDNKILQGTKTITVKSNGSYDDDIKIDFINSTNGNIDLAIDVTAVPSITKLKISNSGNSSLNNSTGYPVEVQNGKRIIKIAPGNSIPYGTYNPILTFCTEDDTSDIALISLPEVITVTQNMTTKYWFKSARNPFLTDSDEDGHSSFVVTPALISEALNTIFYVNGNTTVGKAGNTGSDYSAPLNNITNAFKRINASNNNDYSLGIQRNYIIFIDGKAAAGELIADHPLNLSIYPIDNTSLAISGTFTVGKNVNLTINNFTLSGNFICDDDSTVNVTNSTFSRSLYAGHNPETAAADSTVKNESSITLSNCTITNTVYCYASSNGNEKCTIDATNCTFKNIVTNYGNFTANSCNMEMKLACWGSSSFSDIGTAAGNNSITGTVILNNSSSATFKNIAINDAVTLKNTSNGVFENVVFAKNVDAQSTITFAGTTRFATAATNTLTLRDGVVLKIKDIDDETSKLASIVVATPSPNLNVIQSATDDDITQAQVNRFELHNNGYYLAYDSTSKKGIVKLSSIQIIEPTFGGCTINIDGNMSSGDSDSDIYLLVRSNSAQNIKVTVKGPDGKLLKINSVKQYLGKSIVSSSTETLETEKEILFERSYEETYGLEVRFIYNNIEYSEMLTVKVKTI
ncbi:MAG: hypothetical protein J5527_04535 [Treponema sp.]|nr:hypothetical protein [Treponema sp.]